MKKFIKLLIFGLMLSCSFVFISISTYAQYTGTIFIIDYYYENQERCLPRYYSDKCYYGETFVVESPELEGYYPDKDVIEHVWVDSYRYVVTYKPIEENQKFTLTINYLDENNNPLDDPYVEELSYLAEYSVASPEIYGYSTKSTTVSGTVVCNKTIDVIYKKNDYNLEINYLDEDNNVLFEQYSNTYKYLDEYEITSPEKGGYTPNFRKVSGIISENTTINVIYSKNSYTLKINYLDEDDNQLKTPFEKTYEYLDENNIDIEDFYGYTKDTNNVNGIIEDNTEYTITYSKNEYTLTINYLDVDGNQLLEPYSNTFKYLDTYEITSPAKEGYTPDYDVVEGTITDNTEVDVIYALNEYTLTINYKNVDGAIVAAQYKDTLFYGEAYNIESPSIAGYYTNDTVISGTIKDNTEIDVVYDYIIIHVTIYYVDEFKNNILEPSILNLRFFEDYKIETPRVDGYHTDKDMIEGSVVNTDVTVYINYYRDIHQMTGDQVIIYVATYIKENIGYVSIVFDIFKTIFFPYFSFFRGI